MPAACAMQNGLARFVELIVSARGGAVASSREWNDFRILSELTMHRSTLHVQTANLTAESGADGTTLVFEVFCLKVWRAQH
jgi:hypothetical protein